MITFKPFKAIRPTRDKAYLMASRSYVSYSEEHLINKLDQNPFTFLHVINPDYNKEEKSTGQDRFLKVKEQFEHFKELGYFIEEEKPAFYIYQQQAENHVFTGIIGATHVNDYKEGRVKKHENTLTQREEMFTNYLHVTGFNAEPVLLMHRPMATLGAIKSKYMAERAEYEFTSTDKVLHLLWAVTEDEDIEAISKSFEQIDSVYIADGHHRCASSVRLAEMYPDENQEANKYFLTYFLSDTTIRIHGFDRLVKDLNGMTKTEFLKKLDTNFFVREKEDALYKPESMHEMSMYMHGKWYALYNKPGRFNPEDAVESLDCQILSTLLLDPILDIKDLKTDSRIDFSPGNAGPETLKTAVDSGKYKVAFGLFPVTVEQLKRVSDEGLSMPPKSTYIEPKLRSGLTVYNLNDWWA